MKNFTFRVSVVIIVLTTLACLTGNKIYSQDYATGEEVIIASTNSSVEVNLLQVESLFARVWLYHEILSDNSFHANRIEGKAILNVTWADPTRPISMLEKALSDKLAKAEKLNLEYDKESKGALMSSCKDLYGDDIMDFIMGIIAPLDTQNDSCHKSAPFCTGTIYSFPAGVNTGNGEIGPNYGCCHSTPNPVWYYMKIDAPGNITIKMVGKTANNQSLDIDFALWGPFSDPYAPCTAQLTANCGNNCPNNTTNPNFYPSGNLHDCSYSPAGIEHCHITNGQTGQYFILLITNYDNQRGNITFEKTAGNGTTDCSILPPPASSNSPLCVGSNIELRAANSPGATYSWTGPNGFTSTQQNPIIQNAQYIHSGTYSLTITVNGITSDPSTTEVLVVDPPTAVLTAAGPTTICEGDSTQLTITTTSIGPFRVALGSGSLIPFVMNFPEQVKTIWVHPNDTTTYYLVSVANPGCTGQVSGQVTINVKPKPDPLYSLDNPCASNVTKFTDMTTVDGGSPSTWDWDFGDGSPHSNLQNPSHTYAASGTYNVVLSVLANNGCSESITKQEVIKPTPVVSAGSDVTIPYGTTTQLNGTASGGSGNHTYQWTPADKLDNATILTPTTVGLASTTDFTLTATDQNGCKKSDDMKVTITGGPLTGLIQATPSAICIGSSTTLNTVPSGGSGNYTYSWSSNPPGFSSNIEDPVVSPTTTTTYMVAINDGFNTINAQIEITVYPLPTVNAGQDQDIAHGTKATLTAAVSGGQSPYQYVWDPASQVNDPYSPSTLTKNLYNSTNFNLHVTDAHGCEQTDQVTVNITGGPLQVNPIAMAPVICKYETTKLKALPSGGSNQYTSYSWTSVPAGFTSSQAEPEVTPLVTTTYTVVVSDGFNETSGSVTVTVNPIPLINLIPDDPRVTKLSDTEIGICVFDSVQVSANNPGAEYLWSNGSQNERITIATSGISYDEQTYTVKVTDPLTECSNTGTIKAYFTFEYCSYGLDENLVDNLVTLYPNPSETGVFYIVSDQISGNTSLEVYSIAGKMLYSTNFRIGVNETFKEEINISFAPKGVYFLKLKNLETTIVKKLIIR
jgi:PKD repeat protein